MATTETEYEFELEDTGCHECCDCPGCYLCDTPCILCVSISGATGAWEPFNGVRIVTHPSGGSQWGLDWDNGLTGSDRLAVFGYLRCCASYPPNSLSGTSEMGFHRPGSDPCFEAGGVSWFRTDDRACDNFDPGTTADISHPLHSFDCGPPFRQEFDFDDGAGNAMHWTVSDPGERCCCGVDRFDTLHLTYDSLDTFCDWLDGFTTPATWDGSGWAADDDPPGPDDPTCFFPDFPVIACDGEGNWTYTSAHGLTPLTLVSCDPFELTGSVLIGGSGGYTVTVTL